MAMTRERAFEIARQFMENMNPEEWNGFGDHPASFDDRPYEVPVAENVVVEIEFVANDFGGDEDEGYQTFVDLVDNNGNPYGCYTCIPSANNVGGIADMIEYLYDKYVKEETK